MLYWAIPQLREAVVITGLVQIWCPFTSHETLARLFDVGVTETVPQVGFFMRPAFEHLFLFYGDAAAVLFLLLGFSLSLLRLFLQARLLPLLSDYLRSLPVLCCRLRSQLLGAEYNSSARHEESVLVRAERWSLDAAWDSKSWRRPEMSVL